jgi:hypothetical protein
MDDAWDNWVGDFDGSFAAESLPTAVRGRTTEVLEAFGSAARAIDDGFPAEVSSSTIVRVFAESRFPVPTDLVPLVPEVVAGFLEFLQDGGRLGDGYELAEQIRRLAVGYAGRIKVDGTLKGSTIRRSEKVSPLGRNDPCPCGSGKKYKKCCMREI